MARELDDLDRLLIELTDKAYPDPQYDNAALRLLHAMIADRAVTSRAAAMQTWTGTTATTIRIVHAT